MMPKLPEALFSGPSGTGKSVFVLNWLLYCAERWPGMRGLVVRRTRASLTQSTLVSWEDRVLPVGHPCLKGPMRRYRESYAFPSGSEIVVGGLDSNDTDRVLSSEYDVIFVEEATELAESAWNTLITRLRNAVMPFQQIIGCCNPNAPTHWLKVRADSGRVQHFVTRHQDNPSLYDQRAGRRTASGEQYIGEILEGLTGLERERLLLGRWAGAEGLVYSDFDPLTHVVSPFPIPNSWPRVLSIDFGYENPFVCQFWAIDSDKRMYLYRELYRTKRIVADHALDIHRHLAQDSAGDADLRVVCVSDHDAEDRATLHRANLRTIPARKQIQPGIQAVQQRLRVQGDDKPRLVVFRNALAERDPKLIAARHPLCTEHEFPLYVWASAPDGRAAKEVPVDNFNHGMDAMRYAVMHVDGGGTLGSRFKTQRIQSRSYRSSRFSEQKMMQSVARLYQQ